MTDLPDVDFGLLAQEAAVRHLLACEDALAEEGWNEGEEPPESPASAPFCGCHTCVVREVLYAAWPIFEEHGLKSQGSYRSG